MGIGQNSAKATEVWRMNKLLISLQRRREIVGVYGGGCSCRLKCNEPFGPVIK